MSRPRNGIGHIAMALVAGWYLMIPPVKPYPAVGAATDAPLSQWDAFLLYETPADCEHGHSGRIGLASSRMYNVTIPPNEREIGALSGVEQAKKSLCISSDDPRLNGIRAKKQAEANAAEMSCTTGDPNCVPPPKPPPPYVWKDPALHPTPSPPPLRWK